MMVIDPKHVGAVLM